MRMSVASGELCILLRYSICRDVRSVSSYSSDEPDLWKLIALLALKL